MSLKMIGQKFAEMSEMKFDVDHSKKMLYVVMQEDLEEIISRGLDYSNFINKLRFALRIIEVEAEKVDDGIPVIKEFSI
jgi:hypothetical protein